MSTHFAASLVICPQCRADNPAHNCWLCHAPLAGAAEVVTAELVNAPHRIPLSEMFFLALTVLCLFALVLVGIGIAEQDPGMLVGYFILLAPALIATLAKTLSAKAHGKPVTASQVFLTFLLSASITVAVVVVLMAAAIVALFAYCLYACGQIGK